MPRPFYLFYTLFLASFLLLEQRAWANCGYAIRHIAVENSVCGQATGQISLSLTAAGTYTYLWSNGATTQNLSGLAAGAYQVTISDASNCTISSSVLVQNTAGPSLNSLTSTAANCGNADGRLDLNLSGQAPFELRWTGPQTGSLSAQGSTPSLLNLPAGDYVVEVEDALGCRLFLSAQVSRAGALSLSSTIPQAPTCGGGTNGQIQINTTTGIGPFQYFLNGVLSSTNLNNTFDYTNLSSGLYQIRVVDALGCEASTLVLLDEQGATPIVLGDFQLNDPTCAGANNGSVQKITPSALPYQLFNVQTNTLIGGLPQTSLLAGQYELRLSQAGCLSRLPLRLEEPTAFRFSHQSRNLSCQPGQASLEVGLTGGSGGYVYQWSTGATTQNLSNVFPNFYALTLSDANGCSVSLSGLRVNNCSSSEVFNLSAGASRLVCVDTTDLAGPVATVINLCAGAVNNGILGPIGSDGCFSYQAQGAGNDTVCVQVCNAAGTFCDTTTVIFSVASSIDTFRQVVLANRSNLVCPPLTGLSGSLVSATDLGCAPLNLGLLNGIDQATGCVDYGAGFRMGFDTLCVAYCDNQGVCDTTVLILQVQSPVDTVRQDVNLGATATACPPLFAFPGNVLTVVDLGCAGLSGGSISNLNLSNGCVSFTAGNSPDVDTVCVEVCDDQGFCDTTVLIFTIQPSTRSSYILDTVRLGQVGSNCGVDLSEVPNIQTIINVCAGLGNVRFTLGNVSCLEFEGLSLGRDTACVVVCNAQGLCDTTYFIVEVVLAPPVLGDDTYTVPNTTAPLALLVCDNDTFNRSSYTLRILSQPRLGVLQGADCQLSYRLNGLGVCGRDSFQYSVENPSGVDTAWVYFEVPCRPFSITDGISPNGDGINDYFMVYGIQNYPDHEILIFNRWGALVFQAKDYQNDWMGTFNGRDLPDGQYFYFIYLNNPQGEFYQGSLMILR